MLHSKTPVILADKTAKFVENLKVGDELLSTNKDTVIVLAVEKKPVDKLYTYSFRQGFLTCTEDTHVIFDPSREVLTSTFNSMYKKSLQKGQVPNVNLQLNIELDPELPLEKVPTDTLEKLDKFYQDFVDVSKNPLSFFNPVLLNIEDLLLKQAELLAAFKVLTCLSTNVYAVNGTLSQNYYLELIDSVFIKRLSKFIKCEELVKRGRRSSLQDYKVEGVPLRQYIKEHGQLKYLPTKLTNFGEATVRDKSAVYLRTDHKSIITGTGVIVRIEE